MIEDVDKIKQQIEYLQIQLEQIQEKCLHNNVLKKYESNTGNYDPSADSYWIAYTCPDCGKRWIEDLY